MKKKIGTSFGALFIWLLVLNCRQLISAAWNCDWKRILDHAKRKKRCKSHSRSQNCQAKILHKKDTHVYNNCYELRSRGIKPLIPYSSLIAYLLNSDKTFIYQKSQCKNYAINDVKMSFVVGAISPQNWIFSSSTKEVITYFCRSV